MRSGIFERFERMPKGKRNEFLDRLLSDASARRQTSVSLNQRWLWILERIGLGGNAYSSPLVYRFDGPVEAASVREALEQLCLRHETLRSRFVDAGGEPVVLVSNSLAPFEVVDIRSLPSAQREQAAQDAVSAEVRRGFDLRSESPIRCTMVTVADDDHIVVINCHHIVTDGWSVEILCRELSQLYRAAQTGQSARLPSLPLQYIDFAAWQLEEYSDDRLTVECERRVQAYDGADTDLRLPLDRPRPARQSFRGDVVETRLPARSVTALDAWGRANSATPSMVFYSLFAALLSRYSGQDDFLIGMPEAGRSRAEVADLLGLFLNRIAVRANVTGDPTLTQLLGRVRGASLDAYAHADLPFEKLVEVSGAERRFDRNPLFQVLFAYDTFIEETIDFGGVSGRYVDHSDSSAKFDIVLTVQRLPGNDCRLIFEYATDLFDRSSMENMLADLVRIAESAASDPNGTVSTLPVDPPVRCEESTGGAGQNPHNDTQWRLLTVWAALLGRWDIGVHDDFFASGGTEALAPRLAAEAGRALTTHIEASTVFETPTIAGLAERVLSTADDTPAEKDRLLPVSQAQRRLWFLEHMGLGGSTYNTPMIYRLRGDLDLVALRGAVTDVWRRHDCLRSRFVEVDGEPFVRLSDSAPEFEITTLESNDSWEACRELVTAQVARGFDLAGEPLVRCHVIAVGPTDHVLVLNTHHIVTDGWSEGIIRSDLAAAYRARCAQEPVPARLPQLTYADYAAWQRDRDDASSVEFWREFLDGAPDTLDVPFDRSRPAHQDFNGDTVEMSVPAETAAALEELGRSHNASVFMVYHAIWVALLSRYSGQSDMLIGMPVSGRGRSELSDVVGLFVNTIVLRSSTAGSPSFGELLERVRDNALRAYSHADVPFEKLVAELNVDRAINRNPLFQVFFSFDTQGESTMDLDMGGIEASPVELDEATCKFDLDLSLSQQPDGTVEAALSYATALFDPATIQQMMSHFLRIATVVATGATNPVDQLQLLDEAETSALVGAHRPALETTATTVHEYLERSADAYPAAVAVSAGGRSMTYRELDEAANRLARHLRDSGVGPQDLVGISLPRDERMIVALFGILKAGGAYLPLDPGLPAARLTSLCEDSQVRLVVTDDDHRLALAGFAGRTLSLDEDAAMIAAQSHRRPAATAGSQDLAYVLYTSGSTGKPKGVMVEHRSVTSLVEFYLRSLTRQQVAVVLAASPLSFDASILEIFGTLPLGGCLLMADSAFDLHSLPEAENVTLMQTVPSLMRELLKQGRLPSNLATVCLGGEPLPADLADKVYDAGPVERVYNIYGPTEDTVDTMWSSVPKSCGQPSIGTPLPGTRCYVLDSHGQLAPRGVRGELYLAGPGLARGYLGRDDLTDEKFVPDPFHPGERMYRTGDLVRQRTDGEWDYLGRVDHQVKLRGMRIELGEIEQVLSKLPTVDAAAVRVHSVESGRSELVAYLVCGKGLDEAASRAVLRSRLPEYMVPRSFVIVDSLPLSPNGKLDTAALPEPVFTTTIALAPAVTGTQRELAEIWREVLVVDAIGIHDNFFDAGGTSFGLVAVRSHIGARLSHEVSMVQMYEHTTIAGLAAFLDGADDSNDEADTEVDRGDTRLRGRARLKRRRLSGATTRGAQS